MVKLKLNYMDENPTLKLIIDSELTETEKKLFLEKVIPAMEYDLSLAFTKYNRNTSDLAKEIREITNHHASLDKVHYCFSYYTNENHIGEYWYTKVVSVK